jgi:nucleoside-diphosphate-sugar epimerase
MVHGMRIVVIGGSGMIGRKLAARLTRDGHLGGKGISNLTLFDVAPSIAPDASMLPADVLTGDLTTPGQTDTLVDGRPDVIFHLAAIVSGEAELDFDMGYRINVEGTRNLLESVRRVGHRPRVVLASSIAVFGAPFPDAIPDDFHLTPQTSYGTQKAIAELLLADYTRKGFLDGVGLRLPTICVRPGGPNKAASGFFSGIIREPLAGQEALLPVSDAVRHTHASPRSAVSFMLRGATIDGGELGTVRTLTMPGVSVTVGEQIDALRRVAGDKVARRIRRQPDSFIQRIVSGWPTRVEAKRALALGFTAEDTFDEIIRAHIEDELGGRIE